MGRELSEQIRKNVQGQPTEVNTVYNDASKGDSTNEVLTEEDTKEDTLQQ